MLERECIINSEYHILVEYLKNMSQYYSLRLLPIHETAYHIV